MLFVTTLSTAQYGIGTTSPSPSAQLELNSTSKGFLMPRMSQDQRDAIEAPAAGLMIYNLDTNKPNFFNGISWIELAGVVVGGATVSGAPTDILVTPGDTQASVAFTAPSNNGGATITNYIVTANPGALTAQGTSSPITVTGLVNGTAYTFSVIAVNAVGNSTSSVISSSITPAGAPDAPTNAVASYTSGTTEASVAFDAPANNGGATITGYTVTSNPGGLTATGAASPLVVAGLSMNQAYTFTVVANNGSASVASAASNSITTIPVVPSAPLNLIASSTASGSASVAFDVPTSTGGAAISNYVITSIPAGGSGSGSTSPIAVSGLIDGVEYTFTLVAQNSAGGSPASAPSNAVTPVGAPGAPTNIVASYIAGTTEASIAFDAPANDGGVAITDYTVTSNPVGLTASGPASPLVVTGLSMNQAYTFTVVANNGTTSEASAASNSITTISVVPSAPLNLVASSNASGSASVAFDVPASDGGDAITNYVITSIPAGGTGSGSTSPITVLGLTNGTSYTFTVVAQNSAGDSPVSEVSNAVTPIGTPDAPINVVAAVVSGETQSSVSFTAPTNTGGATITDYTVTSSPGGLTASGTSSPLIVSGLTIGITYTFTVVANNGTFNSAASIASNSITPIIAPPGAPIKLAVLPGNNINNLTWVAPTTGGPVQNYIVQEKKDLGAPTSWTNIATLSSSTLSYTHSNLTNTEGSGIINTSQNYYYRIIASNTTGTATSIEAAGYPVEGTVLVHDNFNSVPSTPIWESVTSFPATIAGQSTTDRFSFTDSGYINRLYGQNDGKWKIVKPSVGNSINCLISTTAGLIDRAQNNGTVIQFSFSPVNGGTYESWSYRFGLFDQSGRIYSFFVNNPATGVTPGTAEGDWASLGITSSAISRNAGGFLSSNSIPGTMHVRIVLPSNGGMKIRINGSLSEWTASEIPATFNNLKFFVMAGKLGNGTSFQTIDNFTITRY